MNVLKIILPVLVMIGLGISCRKWKFLSKTGINDMKFLVTNIMLPVAIFHALATADYNLETGKLVLIMFLMLLISFGIGFLLKPLMTGVYQKYLPFMVSVYEGGLMAYPLYTSLAYADRRIFLRSQYWISQDFCLDSASTWECWDRQKMVRK